MYSQCPDSQTRLRVTAVMLRAAGARCVAAVAAAPSTRSSGLSDTIPPAAPEAPTGRAGRREISPRFGARRRLRVSLLCRSLERVFVEAALARSVPGNTALRKGQRGRGGTQSSRSTKARVSKTSRSKAGSTSGSRPRRTKNRANVTWIPPTSSRSCAMCPTSLEEDEDAIEREIKRRAQRGSFGWSPPRLRRPPSQPPLRPSPPRSQCHWPRSAGAGPSRRANRSRPIRTSRWGALAWSLGSLRAGGRAGGAGGSTISARTWCVIPWSVPRCGWLTIGSGSTCWPPKWQAPNCANRASDPTRPRRDAW